MKSARRIISALALSIGLSISLPVAAAQADPVNPQPYAYGYLVSFARPASGGPNGDYYCMDEYRQTNGDGRPVVLRPCIGSWNQFWFVSQDGLIHSTNDGRCLWGHVPSGPGDSPGATAVGCNAGDPNQRWTFNTDRSVCNAVGACLTFTNNQGPRSSYELWTLGRNASMGETQALDWQHSDSDRPISPNL
ncbi:RICIN domain-containing protein [Kitasatospora sp. NPDC086801]|uniref:RICIN domain-containing protein n=1 Tax=Kitasatospora sp. NPDC086801 TaxID=3364066 RepID=UPI00380E4428